MQQHPVRRLRGRGHRLLLAAAVLGALTAAAPPAALAAGNPRPAPSTSLGPDSSGAGAQRLTFGITPWSAPGASPRATFHYQLADGTHTSDRVSVFNFASVPLTFRLYGADAYTTSQGTVAVDPRATKATDVGSWIRLAIPASSLFRVPARTRVDVGVEIDVPRHAAPGDHVGAVVISLPARTSSPTGATLDVDSRVSALVDVRVAGQVKQLLAVTLLSSRYHQSWNPVTPGSVDLRYRIRNLGNVVVGADQRVTVVGPFGSGRVALPSRVKAIVPGDFVDVPVRFTGVWPLVHYTSRVLVSYVPASGDPSAQPVVASNGTWAIPWAPVLLLLVLLLQWKLRRGWRRRRVLVPAAGMDPEPVAEGVPA